MSTTRDELLDEALRLTFPASDPIAVYTDVPRMKIILFHPGGAIGDRIAREATVRGHHLTVMSPAPFRYERPDAKVVVIAGDALDAERIATVARGFSAVVSVVGPGSDDPRFLAQAASALIDGLGRAGVRRLLVVGGTSPADIEALERYRAADLDWTYVRPAATEPASVAGVVLDELEKPHHVRQQMSAGAPGRS